MKNNRDLKALAVMTALGVVAVLVSLAWPGIKAAASSAYIWSTGGVFTDTEHTFASDGRINGCDPGTDYQAAHGPLYAAYGTSGCIAIPSSSTITEAGGVLGTSTNSSITTNGVAGTFLGMIGGDGTGSADNQRVKQWGLNPLLSDLGHNHSYLLNEFDFNVTGPDTKVIGMTFVGASTHQLAPGSAAFVLGELGHTPQGASIGWTYGWLCGDGATVVCYQAGPQSTGNNSPSQVIRWISRDTNGAIHFDDMMLEAGGDLKISPFGGNPVWIKKDGTMKAKGFTQY